MPDCAFEQAASARTGDGVVCGIDEAGRGPWAGPVVAAAVVLGDGRGNLAGLPRLLRDELDDSKRLLPAHREVLYAALMAAARRGRARFAVAAASAAEIDRINILAATHLAMTRAVRALGMLPALALVDGDRPPSLPMPVETIIGGDGLSLSIAAASVLAKVTRDRLMARLDPRYFGFRWAQNMGYGTLEHREALWRFGPTPHHRMSFAPVREAWSELRARSKLK
ncbi:MAG TPA: ribonuclease HII [Alphaproteobacteria bacterium]|nr:ribonuclease HII [Alphaproteobacteria bacterium]